MHSSSVIFIFLYGNFFISLKFLFYFRNCTKKRWSLHSDLLCQEWTIPTISIKNSLQEKQEVCNIFYISWARYGSQIKSAIKQLLLIAKTPSKTMCAFSIFYYIQLCCCRVIRFHPSRFDLAWFLGKSWTRVSSLNEALFVSR